MTDLHYFIIINKFDFKIILIINKGFIFLTPKVMLSQRVTYNIHTPHRAYSLNCGYKIHLFSNKIKHTPITTSD